MRKEIPRKFIIICDGCGAEGMAVDAHSTLILEDESWCRVHLLEVQGLKAANRHQPGDAQHEFCPKCADILRTTLKAILPAKVEAAPDA